MLAGGMHLFCRMQHSPLLSAALGRSFIFCAILKPGTFKRRWHVMWVSEDLCLFGPRLIWGVATIHAAITLHLSGLSWFVQSVFYAGYLEIGPTEFQPYERLALQRVTRLITPLMLGEILTAVMLVLMVSGFARILAELALSLLAGIWISTLFIQLPLHRNLKRRGRDLVRIRSLVRTQWIRTIGSTLRGAAALGLLFLVLR